MKPLLFAACFLLFVSSCIAALNEGASTTIPLFAWSDKEIFSNKQLLETITEEDIENSLHSLLGIGTKEGFIKNIQSVPEVVVLFVEPQLQTDQIPRFGSAYSTSINGGSFSGLKGIMEASKSSLIAPYATAGISFSLLDSVLGSAADKVDIVLARDQESTLFHELSRNDNVKVVGVDDIKNLAEVFNNGKVELLIVCLDNAADATQFTAHDDLIGSVANLVSTATSGNFVGMYTGNSAPANLLWTFSNPNAALFEQPTFGMLQTTVAPSNITGNSTVDTYFTGAMLEVFMVVIALLTMVFVGVCNICSLQVPETFEAPKPQQKTL